MSQFLRPLGIDVAGRNADLEFDQAWTRVSTLAEASLASSSKGRDVGDRESGWGHNYFCPIHGEALAFDELRPDEHRCEKFDHELTGEQYDTGWAYVRNYRLVEHLEASALASAVSRASEHTDRAIEILTGLAQVYASLPLHGRNVGQGRFMNQSLEEAVAATSLARSYALVADQMSDAQRSTVLEFCFMPMVETIQSQLMDKVHNIELWHLAGLASLAVVLEDRDLAETTLTAKNGFRDQIAHGVLADGWWFEGSPGYHFYMLTAVMAAVESYRAFGLESAGTAELERMLLSPIETARNDLTVPSFNDTSPLTTTPPGIANHSSLYFQGARLCSSEALDRFLDSSLARSFDRAAPAYLVYGRTGLASNAVEDGWPLTREGLLPASGYAILRQPEARRGTVPDTALYLKFGPHGGGHGHPDKLSIDLMVDGDRVIADPGTAMYTHELHEPWYVQTWSHSTVIIDRISQPPIRAELLSYKQVTDDDFGCIDARATFGPAHDSEALDLLWHRHDDATVAAYDGTTIRRLIAMTPASMGSYLLDVVVVETPVRRTIDLVTHVRGVNTAPSGRRAPARLLLPQFRQVERADRPDGRTDYELTDSGRRWSRWHTGADELLTAVTPSNPPHESCASTIERVVGSRAVFVAAMPLGSTRIEGLHTSQNGLVQLTVDSVAHSWRMSDPAPEAAGRGPRNKSALSLDRVPAT